MTIHSGLNSDLWFLSGDNKDIASDEAAESFAAKLAEVDGLKTFPVVAQQAISILSNPDFRVIDVTGALEQDPSLAAGVVRMANSAFFAGSKPVSTIGQAFIRLGRQAVQEVIASVATMDLFPDVGGIGKKVRDHCAATAAIVQALARQCAPKHSDGIFLCGLLHDVGKMLLVESREFEYVGEENTWMQPDAIYAIERDMLGYDHAVLGGHVLERWKLPAPIPYVVAWHHQPSRAYSSTGVGPMVALLRVADHIDYAMAKSGENFATMLEPLADSMDLAKAGVTLENIKDYSELLLESRENALTVFGG